MLAIVSTRLRQRPCDRTADQPFPSPPPGRRREGWKSTPRHGVSPPVLAMGRRTLATRRDHDEEQPRPLRISPGAALDRVRPDPDQFVVAAMMLNTPAGQTTAGFTQGRSTTATSRSGSSCCSWRSRATPGASDAAPRLGALPERRREARAESDRTLLHFCMLMPISGFVFVMAGGYGVNFFGAWHMPNFIGRTRPAVESRAESTHRYGEVLLLLTLPTPTGRSACRHQSLAATSLVHQDAAVHARSSLVNRGRILLALAPALPRVDVACCARGRPPSPTLRQCRAASRVSRSALRTRRRARAWRGSRASSRATAAESFTLVRIALATKAGPRLTVEVKRADGAPERYEVSVGPSSTPHSISRRRPATRSTCRRGSRALQARAGASRRGDRGR